MVLSGQSRDHNEQDTYEVPPAAVSRDQAIYTPLVVSRDSRPNDVIYSNVHQDELTRTSLYAEVPNRDGVNGGEIYENFKFV